LTNSGKPFSILVEGSGISDIAIVQMLKLLIRMVGLDGRFDAFGPGASVISLLQAFLALIGASMLTGDYCIIIIHV
jgi:hypothetical protein